MNNNLLMISGKGALTVGKHGAFYHTLEELSKHFDRIDIIAPRSQERGTQTFFGNVHVHPSPLPLWLQPWWIYRAGSRLMREHAISLMTVHDYPPFYNGLGAAWLHAATGISSVVEIMHIPGLPRAGSFKERFYRGLTRICMAWITRYARMVRIINQKQTKDFLMSAGVPANKLRYIPAFYIDLEIFRPETREKKYDLVCAARLEKNKGILNLIKAVEILKQDNPQIKLGVIGDGPLRKNLEHYAGQHGLRENIEFLGWLDGPKEIAQIFNASRVFVNPSLNEGGPRVVLEAMACGVPVVTTPVGLMLDIIQDLQNGLMSGFEPEELAAGITNMLKDGIADQCIAGGLETVKQFERVSAITNYANEIKKLNKKRLLVVTQKVDEQDQLLGFFVEWLRRLGHETELSVLCLQKGTYNLPNTRVTSLGKEHGVSKIGQLFDFYTYIIEHRREYDSVFVHMNPIWAALGGPIWRLMGKKIILWYTHKAVTLKLRIATFFAHVILTASRESFRLPSRKVIVTGHGIDTDFFKPEAGDKTGILTLGRIAPVKNYEILIEVADKITEPIIIAGEPALPHDYEYLEHLKDIIKNKNLTEKIKFIGKIDYKDLPKVYNSHSLFVHMSKTGSLDKAMLEAMACGLTVISSNDAAKSILSQKYIFEPDSSESLTKTIDYALSNPHTMRAYVVEHHPLEKLIARISEVAQ